MSACITLVNLTDHGARAIKDSPDRSEVVKPLAETGGVNVKSAHWTTGAYDKIIVAEGADDALMARHLEMASLGNVRTQSQRVYNPPDAQAGGRVAGLSRGGRHNLRIVHTGSGFERTRH